VLHFFFCLLPHFQNPFYILNPQLILPSHTAILLVWISSTLVCCHLSLKLWLVWVSVCVILVFIQTIHIVTWIISFISTEKYIALHYSKLFDLPVFNWLAGIQTKVTECYSSHIYIEQCIENVSILL
jgi:hypothetical protein